MMNTLLLLNEIDFIKNFEIRLEGGLVKLRFEVYLKNGRSTLREIDYPQSDHSNPNSRENYAEQECLHRKVGNEIASAVCHMQRYH